MTRSWRALPLTSMPRVLAKAPDYGTFLDQQHDIEKRGGFFLPRLPEAELPHALTLMEAIQDVRSISIGEKFELWRYPNGLSVKGASGWTFMVPYDIPKRAKGKGAAGTDTPAEGEREPVSPAKGRRAKATS